ncbi:conserved hypothetical protein [Ricinus communis]|uniref:Retrotransposon Copia-like N-terminal domain-containing protein n=1 Tax=Ricinus communis TaxID=3988 RepID=B9S869_RICCO|nr:conserved hypothetical protein [Ricinus communis]
MKLALRAKDKLGYINSEIVKPASTAKEYKMSMQRDSSIAALLRIYWKKYKKGLERVMVLWNIKFREKLTISNKL